MAPASLVWLRQDLRLTDNLALLAAAHAGGPVIPVFVLCREEHGEWAPGAASRWWLHYSLLALQQALRRRGSRLVIRRGPSLEALQTLARKVGARSVFWNRCYEPALRERPGSGGAGPGWTGGRDVQLFPVV